MWVRFQYTAALRCAANQQFLIFVAVWAELDLCCLALGFQDGDRASCLLIRFQLLEVNLLVVRTRVVL